MACEAGAILVGGKPAKASQTVAPGELVSIRFSNHTLDVRLLELPAKSTSRKAAREMYEVLRDEKNSLL